MTTVDLISCQSGTRILAHGDTTGDAVTHYFGCLKDSERGAFLTDLSEAEDKVKKKIKEKIQAEEDRIRKLRDIFDAEGESTASGQLLCQFKLLLDLRRTKNTAVGNPSDPTIPHNNSITAQSKEEREKQFLLDDVNANVIYFKKKEDYDHLGPYDHPKFLPTTFPDQKVPLSRLLNNNPDESPLMWDCEPDMIRYFHIPANNMEWIEEAIARYYREDRPDLSGPYRKPRTPEEQSKTRMLLRPQFWKGLQHGDRPDLPTHTRHMRPRCYPISTNHQSLEQPKNIALFMPYLHWETDRRRSRTAEVVMRYDKPLFQFADVVDSRRQGVTIDSIKRTTSNGPDEQITTILEHSQNQRQIGPKKITFKSYSVGETPLGKLFLLAAKLYEEMDSYTDEKIIGQYLMNSSPLHPRRTLDQSYYWTLRDTRSRDRDQVVYRGTAPSPKLLHHDCPKKFTKREKKEKPCVQCHENSKKVARVVMVDQLWMWILDENTIITSFPKRLGRNKPDISAVQKCIRTRLRAARIDEIRSVYDLGILIIDQCSRVFFHRTRAEDLQPQVMDCFANAIGRVNHKQSIAFDHFWECTRLASKRYASRDQPDNGTGKKSQNVLLDINPEGELLRETKDIIDEISIMVQIKKQEENVTRTFLKQINTLIQKHPSPNSQQAIRSESSLRQQAGSFSPGLKPSPTFLPQDPTWSDYDWTMMSATELAEGIQNQLLELKILKEAAENASQGLKDLLSLKQQQASVVEAREAVKQGEETLRQGRAIMLFTIITIIFLPLSFFAAIFGMNVTDGTKWKYKDVFKFMIPISVIVIFGSLCLAFSELVRAILSWMFNIAWTKLITLTPMYVSWRDTSFDSKRLHESRKIRVNKMKREARREARQKAMEKKEAELQRERDAREEEERKTRKPTRPKPFPDQGASFGSRNAFLNGDGHGTGSRIASGSSSGAVSGHRNRTGDAVIEMTPAQSA